MPTVTAEVEVDLDDFDTEDLRKELRSRGVDPDENDPLLRIWQAVTYQGLALEDVIDDLMRERGYLWPSPMNGSVRPNQPWPRKPTPPGLRDLKEGVVPRAPE